MVKKISVFIMILGLFFVGIPRFEVKAQEVEIVNYSNNNLAFPIIENVSGLFDGLYTIYNDNGIIIDYNVYNGFYTINGTAQTTFALINSYSVIDKPLTISHYYINGSKTNQNYFTIRTYLNGTGVSNNENINDSFYIINDTSNGYGLYFDENEVYDNYQFKIQLEKGDTATPYVVPLYPLLWHEMQLSYNDGYNEGFNDGLDEVFNTNNLMPFAEIRERGTYGPSNNLFGFTIPINKKVNSITLLNLIGYPLKPIDWFSSGFRQGFNVIYEDNTEKLYSFYELQINDFNDMIYIDLDINKVVDSITLVLALDNASMPNTDYDDMLEHMGKNLGVYINNKILNDNAIAKFKQIIERQFINGEEYQYLLEIERQKGYNKGLNETDATGFVGLLTAVFGGLGALLGIELLPGIYIGAIIAVPLVFGIIFFILGKRKGD